MNGFVVGDVVRLWCGGPKMTVSRSNQHDEWVEVVWFTEDGELRQNSVRFRVLKKVDADKESS